MEIIFCHHAQRDRSQFKGERHKQGITKLGEQDAKLFAQMMNEKGKKLTAVYTSPFFECKKKFKNLFFCKLKNEWQGNVHL